MKKNKISLLIAIFMVVSVAQIGSYWVWNTTLKNSQNESEHGVSVSNAEKEAWYATWGGSDLDYGHGIALDDAGNIYITGYTYSFGAGEKDAFVVCYNGSGSLQWNTTWGGSSWDDGAGVTVDGTGNIYITGSTASFGAGSDDAYVVCYNGSGNQQWNATWGGSDSDCGYGVAVDGAGNIYITGYTYSFGAGEIDAFVVCYNGSGSLQWYATWGGSDNDWGYGIAVDGAGNIYITGYTENFGAGETDAFVACYDDSGAQEWDATWGGSSVDSGAEVTVDGAGNIYITGVTYSFGAGEADAFVMCNMQNLPPFENREEKNGGNDISSYPLWIFVPAVVFTMIGLVLFIRKKRIN